jgi:hypothetical protein
MAILDYFKDNKEYQFDGKQSKLGLCIDIEAYNILFSN